jgi:hypothetical protein
MNGFIAQIKRSEFVRLATSANEAELLGRLVMAIHYGLLRPKNRTDTGQKR